MNRWHPFTLLVLLALLLAACSPPDSATLPQTSNPPGEELGEAAVVERLRAILDDVASVRDPALLDALLAASQAPVDRPGCPAILSFLDPDDLAITPQNLMTLSGTMLARGSYRYDPDANACSFVADTDTLVLRYPFLSFDEDDPERTRLAEAELVIDWGGETLDVRSAQGDLVEVPRTVHVSLGVDGHQVADVDADFAWYGAPECREGIFEATHVSLSGWIGGLHLDVGYDLTEDGIRLHGELKAEAGIKSAFDVRVEGEVERAPCFAQAFRADAGSLTFSLDSMVGAQKRSLELSVALREPVFVDFPDISVGAYVIGGVQGLTSVVLEAGVLKLDGETAASFAGVLDDENANGVSGENVTVTFANGDSTTLEAFLMNDFGVAFSLD